MIKRVFEYDLSIERAAGMTLQLPIGAVPLKIDLQDMKPMLWALVDPDADTEPRRFAIFGTGRAIDAEPIQYVSTFFTGPYVFHAFEVSP